MCFRQGVLFCSLVFTAKGFLGFSRVGEKNSEICDWNSTVIYFISMQFLYLIVAMNCLAMSE